MRERKRRHEICTIEVSLHYCCHMTVDIRHMTYNTYIEVFQSHDEKDKNKCITCIEFQSRTYARTSIFKTQRTLKSLHITIQTHFTPIKCSYGKVPKVQLKRCLIWRA